ncbi:MAG: hypothetical protein AAGE94_05335 [Acidobacteriota bacterium]
MTARNLPRASKSLRALAFSPLLLLLAMTPTVAEADTSFELRPGLVIDPSSSTAFLMAPAGAIEAIDLDQGAVRWTSTDAARPLTVVQDRLVAQVERRAPGPLSLVALDAASGRARVTRDVELPDGMIPGVVDGLGVSFVSRAEAQTSGVLVSWTYDRKSIGAIPDDQRGDAKAEALAGALWLDPVSGAVETRSAPTKAAPASIQLDGSARLSRVDARQFRSADGRHVLASERIADGRTWNRYRWTIYTASGERLGELDTPVSYAPFAVIDGVLVYEAGQALRRVGGEMVAEPLRVVAVSLPGGVVQWTRAIRDTAYRGPFPP